jgi:hypothetical protein
LVKTKQKQSFLKNSQGLAKESLNINTFDAKVLILEVIPNNVT